MRLTVLASTMFVVLMAGALPVHAASARPQIQEGVRPMLMPHCDDGSNGGGIDPEDIAPAKHTPLKSLSSRTVSHGASLAIGTDRASIEAKFATNIEANFQRSPETLLSRLSDKEIAAIFRHYNQNKGLDGSPLMKTIASRVSAESLVRLRTIAGPAVVDNAVSSFAEVSVRANYTSQAVARPYVSKVTTMSGPAPTIDMTLEEIYLEFRTAPVGSVGPAAAVAETGMFAGVYVGASWESGTVVGTQINNIITEYDPSLGDAIGGTLAGIVDSSRAAVDDVSKGHFQSAIDELFGYPVTDANEGAADYDVASPMVEYYGDGGGCGM